MQLMKSVPDAGIRPADSSPKVILSRELFRDGPVLRIVHGEQVYVLRRTSTDKLILTK